jgi:hypothetical protein
MNARPAAFIAAMAMALSLLCAAHATAQKCPRGPIDLAALTAQMETTKDPNVILRAAAIAGQKVVPTLRKLAIPETSPETVGGAAQASLAKLGDEATYAELEGELNRKDFLYTVWTIEKLLIVNTPRSISMIIAFLDAHPGPITLGCETDACYDDVPIIFNALADVVENAPIRTNGKFTGSREDWTNWSKHEKPIPFSISGDLQDPYEQCLGRKVEWGFDMALVDLGATGDQRAVPAIRKLGTMGYPYNGYVGTRAPFIWLRHDYVETALAELGDAEEFAIIAHELHTNAFQTAAVKMQIIGGKKAMSALLEASVNPDYAMFNQALFKCLSQMVQAAPLLPNADPTAENLQKWQAWWAKNKDTARFVNVSAYE